MRPQLFDANRDVRSFRLNATLAQLIKVKGDTFVNVEGKCSSDAKSDISSVGRAIPCQGIGHRFEPDMSLQIKI